MVVGSSPVAVTCTIDAWSFINKETPTQVLSCHFCEIFMNTLVTPSIILLIGMHIICLFICLLKPSIFKIQADTLLFLTSPKSQVGATELLLELTSC